PSGAAVKCPRSVSREKNSGSKCVISMHSGTTTTIQDPKNPEHVKTFTFDLAYWSHKMKEGHYCRSYRPKKIIREYYEQLNASKFNNTDKVDISY
uniref:Uncharacterized protein n=1 Tax=Equus asinus asinus TaxID=83772 RepID=A0A8C4LEI0_EQUAS